MNWHKFRVREDVYDTYWKFAAERQEIFFKKLTGVEPPFTEDPILRKYKFCNAYRVCDRISQYLIREVIYRDEMSEIDTLFRIFIFRLLNKINTWTKLENILGRVGIDNFEVERYSRALDKIKAEDGTIYGNAFILCANKAFGFERKQDNHMALMQLVFQRSNMGKRLLKAKSMKELYQLLKSLPLMGEFMAYQVAIDFNYSEVFNFDENEFTQAGPGALRGVSKVFADSKGIDPQVIIMKMVERQDEEFNRLGLKFKKLGNRPLKAIDCQGLFCELDKYCRIRFPYLVSSKKKIKTIYKQNNDELKLFFPPKWKIKSPIP